jgi:hypothetical protein
MIKIFAKTLAYMKHYMLLCTHNDTASVTLETKINLLTFYIMSQFFDTLKTIALSNKPQSVKVKEMQKATGMTAAAAARQQIATIVFMNQSASRAERANNASLRFTIGVEIECYNLNKSAVLAALRAESVNAIETGYNHTDYTDTYKLGYDGSISGSNGCEVVSPILRNLSSLKKVCKVINEAGAKVNKSCGLHVHFGAKDFTIAQWVRIIRNYAALEEIIDSFMPASRRGSNNGYCKSVAGPAAVLGNYGATCIDDLYSAFRRDRYHKVNVMAFRGHKTIEFRHHSGTTDFTKIEMWINFLRGLLEYSINNETIISASSIDEIPFLTNAQKSYFNNRKSELNR